MLTLIVKGSIEESIAEVAARLGGDLPVEQVSYLDHRQTIVVLGDAPLGHDVVRWMVEGRDLVSQPGIGYPTGTLLHYRYS